MRAHLTLLKMLMRTRKSVTSIAILKARVKSCKNITDACQWKSCALYPQNEIVEFLDQCSCYLRFSGSVGLIFDKSILSLWLTLFWPLLTAKLKASFWAHFHNNFERNHKWGIQSAQKASFTGFRLQRVGICFVYFPHGRGNCCYRHALVCNGEGESTQFWRKIHLPGTTSGLTMKLTQLTMTNMQLGR